MALKLAFNPITANFDLVQDVSGLVKLDQTTPQTTVGSFQFPYIGAGIAPTARLTLAAGSATAGTAPLKFTSGPLTTVAVAGQIEYLSNYFYIRGTDKLALQLGTAGLPSYTFESDLDTGMWSSAANIINFSLGGTNNLEFDNYFGETRIASKTATAIQLWANGNNAFRALDGWTGTWADTTATTYFQTGRNSGQTMFSAYQGTPYNRLSFACNNNLAGRGVLFTTLASAIAVPTGFFEIRQGTASNLFVQYTTGFIGLGTATPTALLDVNSDIIRLRTAKTPATAGATGNAGDICWDANYIYVCTATNQWERVAIATW